jgi:transcriptional regulator with XRE-family HTH domain
MFEIASKHKLIRKQLKLSQGEFSKRSGVSVCSIKRFESGQISLGSLLKLAQILNRLNDFELVFKSIENLEEIEKKFSDKTRS